ncbi:hypothetical protein Ct9H90mP29_22070 [bacterium]|nr:MAG: hypothetical protein Ct9H90mP29_22070 [bacterium]
MSLELLLLIAAFIAVPAGFFSLCGKIGNDPGKLLIIFVFSGLCFGSVSKFFL